MAIAEGDRIPDVKVMALTEGGPQPLQTGEALGKGKVVLFAVPGAFTPTCNDHHLPGFVIRTEELKAKGVSTIACIAVNDPWVMGAWGKAQGADDILMLADGNGDFAAESGLSLDLTGLGLGVRCQRYAAILQDGVVQELFIEPNPGAVDVSGSDKVLKAL